ncbi:MULTISPECIES: MarR family winged helix-turn-helix transcriptional regulator [Rhodobacterales]|jgi:MarR family transcriptional regulator, lower aerobic nicotinate degradation pathway regulator|nr:MULTISPECIES: MarR family winged helix-turn-helix transcriptional regulator [Rhodobacterales]KMK64074.1 transcriptional regulator [Puniceibacterium sp. IMCC21224]WHZ38456.1 MarR family winged helix-turn-helix transcriptional regulator [Sagittula sp. MA-2]
MNEATHSEIDIHTLRSHPGHLIRRSYQIFLSMFEAVGKDVDLSPVRWILIATIRLRPGLSMAEVSFMTGVDKASTGRTIRNLEGSGLIRVVRSAHDKRERRVYTTTKGDKLVHAFYPRIKILHDDIMAAFEPEEAKEFVRLLGKFIEVNDHRSRAALSDNLSVGPL